MIVDRVREVQHRPLALAATGVVHTFRRREFREIGGVRAAEEGDRVDLGLDLLGRLDRPLEAERRDGEAHDVRFEAPNLREDVASSFHRNDGEIAGVTMLLEDRRQYLRPEGFIQNILQEKDLRHLLHRALTRTDGRVSVTVAIRRSRVAICLENQTARVF
jgi:hypothetical protein